MAFKLSRAQEREFEELLSKLGDARTELENATTTFNEEVEKLRAPVEAAAEAFNSIAFDLREFVSNFTADMQSEFDDKSERWQEGDRGQSVGAWIQAWETAGDGFEDVEIEFPDDLDVAIPDFDEQPYEPSV